MHSTIDVCVSISLLLVQLAMLIFWIQRGKSLGHVGDHGFNPDFQKLGYKGRVILVQMLPKIATRCRFSTAQTKIGVLNFLVEMKGVLRYVA